MNTLQIKNPYSGELLGELQYATPEETRRVVATSVTAFQKWRHSSAWERSELLLHAARQLEVEKEDFAQLIRQEAGKPISAARGEVDRAIGVLRWGSGEAQRFAGELLRLDASATGRPGFGINTRFPRGVILGITPYNFPLNLAMHKVAPAVACGCSIIVKPSSSTPLTALKLARLFESSVPGLVQVLLTNDASTSELTRLPEIAMISFTGSTAIGWKIRQQAPEKPTALELGGNAWVLVMEDTPASAYPAIARKIANAAFGYAGQSCISVQNVGVASAIREEFSSHLKTATEATPYGDPSSSSVISGPLIHRKAAVRVQTQIQKAIGGGAEVICAKKQEGNCAPLSQADAETETSSNSSLVVPSLVVLNSNAKNRSKQGNLASSLVQDEVFGPVMTISEFADIPEIIKNINASRYGLQAGIFTQNWPAIERFYRELEVGGVVINDVPTTRYDHQPYGGVKDSGQGREGLRYAMEEMTESKFLALSGRV
ncbi:MAG: aldehyde dehydrogenase family protein [Bdellovibrionia bacterium]